MIKLPSKYNKHKNNFEIINQSPILKLLDCSHVLHTLKFMFTELVYCGVAILKIFVTETINDLKIYRTINILSHCMLCVLMFTNRLSSI